MKIFSLRNIISFFLCGIVIFMAYLIAGVIGEHLDFGLTWGDAVLSVCSTPLSNHFNDLSPIAMVIGFLIFEIIWFFTCILPNIGKNKETENNLPDMESEDILSETKESVFTQEAVNSIDLLAEGFVLPEHLKNLASDEQSTDNEEETDFRDIEYIPSQSNISDDEDQEYKNFRSNAYWVLHDEYSNEQINEMTRLFKFNKLIEPGMLSTLFDHSLSSEDIRWYINTFYEVV